MIELLNIDCMEYMATLEDMEYTASTCAECLKWAQPEQPASTAALGLCGAGVNRFSTLPIMRQKGIIYERVPLLPYAGASSCKEFQHR